MKRFNHNCRRFIPIPPTGGGAEILISADNVKGITSDARIPIPCLAAVSVHPDAINCSDGLGRRWTLLTCARDLLPRSALLNTLPSVVRGDLLSVDFSNAPVLFRTRRANTVDIERWSGLTGEWVDLLNDGGLAALRTAVEGGYPLPMLSGLGTGFTPEGDDFITGWITAKLSTKAWSALAEVRLFYESWDQEGTTWFSKWMIRDAARGRIWRRGALLLEAMEDGRGKDAADAAADILNWGHTSGRAWLAGLAFGFMPGEARKGMISCKSWKLFEAPTTTASH